jgi:FixJ family two-component response regulator
MRETSAVVVVRDAVLASSLELALLAAGLGVIVHDPEQGLDDLPLDRATTLIVEHSLLKPSPATFIAALRARPWLGLVILMTGDEEAFRFEKADRVTILEMPFQAAALIAAVQAEWPMDDGSGTAG